MPTLPVCPTSLWAALSFPYITAALLISQLDILQEKVVTSWCYQQRGYCHFYLHCLCSEPPQVEIVAFPSIHTYVFIHLWIVNRCSRTAKEQHHSDLAQLHQASASSRPTALPWLSPLRVFWHQTRVIRWEATSFMRSHLAITSERNFSREPQWLQGKPPILWLF